MELLLAKIIALRISAYDVYCRFIYVVLIKSPKIVEILKGLQC